MTIPECPAIVVIDDDADVCLVLKRVLKLIAPGYPVYCCATGRDALSYIADHSVSCVITDYQMSDMDGLILAQMVTTQWPDIAVIMFTGSLTNSVQEAAYTAGCLIALEKPVSIEIIRSIILPLLAPVPVL